MSHEQKAPPQHRERRQGARCRLIERVIAEFGHLDVLMNNAAAQHPQEGIANTNLPPSSWRAMSRTLGGPL